MIRSRGYSTKRFKTLQSAYYNKPTPLQQASYHVHLIDLVRDNDVTRLDELISCGISANPCNNYGESLVHMLCRRGDHPLLEVLLRHGCSLAVADDYGRTPLHDACWAAQPAFSVVELIAQTDIRLFHMIDARGAVPLSYVRKEHAAAWVDFLDSKKDEYWPVRNVAVEGEQGPPPLCLEAANSRPIRDPENALTVELAGMVASGRMEPEEAQFLKHDLDGDATQECTIDDEESDWDSDDEDYDSSFSETFNEDEMADILTNLAALNSAKPVAWSEAH